LGFDGSIHILFNPQIVTPIGTFGADVGVSVDKVAGTTILIIRHKKAGTIVDDAYRIKQEFVSVDVDGRTTVQVSNGRVLVDASRSDISNINIGNPPTSAPGAQTVAFPQRFLFETGIPKAPATTLDITVNPGELHVVTSGRICVFKVCLSESSTQGSVAIFEPPATYNVYGLVSEWNSHDGYYGVLDQWPLLAADKAKWLYTSGCSGGCQGVNVLVVGPNGPVLGPRLYRAHNVHLQSAEPLAPRTLSLPECAGQDGARVVQERLDRSGRLWA
jgi:hypothetical protein